MILWFIILKSAIVWYDIISHTLSLYHMKLYFFIKCKVISKYIVSDDTILYYVLYMINYHTISYDIIS